MCSSDLQTIVAKIFLDYGIVHEENRVFEYFVIRMPFAPHVTPLLSNPNTDSRKSFLSFKSKNFIFYSDAFLLFRQFCPKDRNFISYPRDK